MSMMQNMTAKIAQAKTAAGKRPRRARAKTLAGEAPRKIPGQKKAAGVPASSGAAHIDAGAVPEPAQSDARGASGKTKLKGHCWILSMQGSPAGDVQIAQDFLATHSDKHPKKTCGLGGVVALPDQNFQIT